MTETKVTLAGAIRPQLKRLIYFVLPRSPPSSEWTFLSSYCVQCAASIGVAEDIKPNSVHMALQIPQYFLITAGEVVFSVTGLEFSYSQVKTTRVMSTSMYSFSFAIKKNCASSSVVVYIFFYPIFIFYRDVFIDRTNRSHMHKASLRVSCWRYYDPSLPRRPATWRPCYRPAGSSLWPSETSSCSSWRSSHRSPSRYTEGVLSIQSSAECRSCFTAVLIFSTTTRPQVWYCFHTTVLQDSSTQIDPQLDWDWTVAKQHINTAS